MSAKEFENKTPVALRAELIKLRREQFNLRMAAAAGQPAKPDQHGKVRKQIARVKTVMSRTRVGGKG
jgi:large subunit ribosomal protein L29